MCIRDSTAAAIGSLRATVRKAKAEAMKAEAAAKNNVHDLAKVHTTRFLVSQPFILLPRVSFGIVR